MAAKGGGFHPFRDIADSVHIKKNTAGTSNEISLSVLDGLKSRADDRFGEADPKVKLGDLSLYTVESKKDRKLSDRDALKTPATTSLFGASSAKPAPSKGASSRAAASSAGKAGKRGSASSGKKATRAQRNRERALRDPEKEIKRRKKNRRRRRIAFATCGVAACCIAVAAGVMFAADAYDKHQDNLALLSQAFDEIEKADMLVLDMDDKVMEEDADFSDESIEAMAQGIEDAGVHLNAACAFADKAAASMGESSGKDAAYQVNESADARRDMMQYAEALLSADRQAKESVDEVQACWDFVIEADALMKEAAQLVADTTEENVRASQAKTEEALASLEQAQESLARAQQEYPSADFSALSAFIEKKKEQNGYALASDDAIYIQDKATAEAFNEKYNQADAEAVELAKSLPEKPAQPILDRLDAHTSETRESYLDARKRAAESDAFIRDYLGQSKR
ncbi:MAG: hypothetical protein Q4B69_02210 [Slackia sp.]|nr:hypothetical protein [Slackia sp.]